MPRLFIRTLGLVLLLVTLSLWPLRALAHEIITLGDYELEYGWLHEPVIVGQPNAIVLTFAHHDSEPEAVDVSDLNIEIIYGPEQKTLALQPLGEDTPGQFIAPVTPTRAGQYTVRLTGKISETSVGPVDFEPEEVESAALVQFPRVASTSTDTLSLTLASIAFVLGLVGVGLGVFNLRKK